MWCVQDYVAAMEDFQQSLELKRSQPIAMLYKGLTFFHRGLLKVNTPHVRVNSSLQNRLPQGWSRTCSSQDKCVKCAGWCSTAQE